MTSGSPPDTNQHQTNRRLTRQDRWFGALLAAVAALLYGWDLTSRGAAQEYYTAAATAGARSWRALLVGGLDRYSSITLDKPAGGSWLTGLSVRLFGEHGWALVAPHAAVGVAAVVGVWYVTHRVWNRTAGRVAGIVMVCSPTLALVARQNAPDIQLVAAMVAAAAAAAVGVQRNSAHWWAAAGALTGFAFLTKQAFVGVVVVGVGVGVVAVYRTHRPAHLARHVLVAGGVAAATVTAWFVAVAVAASDSYIGGSGNGFWPLIAGYNGLDRLTGQRTNHMWANVPDDFSSGPAGPLRLLTGSGGIHTVWWLIPWLVSVAGTWRQRTRFGPGALMLYTTMVAWSVTGVVVLSAARGIYHDYYTAVLSPAVAVVVAVGVTVAFNNAPTTWSWQRTGVVAGTVVATLAAQWNVAGDATFGALPIIVAAAGVTAGGISVAARQHRHVAASAVVVACSVGAAGATITAAGTPVTGTVVSLLDVRAAGPVIDDDELDELVEHVRRCNGSRWQVAATPGPLAGTLQLHAGVDVLAVGGFHGTDPYPTFDEIVDDITDGDIGCVVVADTRLTNRSGDVHEQLWEWVARNGEPTTTGQFTLWAFPAAHTSR